jgi:hypothetical protein
MLNKTNPNEILKQVMGNMSNEQKTTLLKQAKGYGVPNEILAKIQNMK